MRGAHFEALLDALDDHAVEFDGLFVRRAGAASDGDDHRYTFATPAAEHTDLTETELHSACEEHERYVSNWYYWAHEVDFSDSEVGAGPRYRDFCRWVEYAPTAATPGWEERREVPERYAALEEGVAREWGQLRLEATVDADGTRRYEVRHVDDAEADAADLVAYGDPLDARDVAKTDDRGRYRPLKAAPTLDGGWVFTDLDARGLVDAVDTFYPATIANWHRERDGDLDVTHWRETMERQTGIYGVIETWDRGEGHEHVNWVAEACCEDSQCLKRREWEYDGDTDLDVDGGDGVFPCREPCSLVVSAARKWTQLEGEETRTYEFELTESEKEQVEAIIDAVADGRAADVREADIYDGANRYRTRFLRAKRFDGDGHLGGVPTTPDDGA